jgi:hypothetical protein
MDWTDLAQDRNKWRPVEHGNEPSGSKKMLGNSSVAEETRLHGVNYSVS